jgi:hypothetical protein
MTSEAVIQLLRVAFPLGAKPTVSLADAAVADAWGDESVRFVEQDRSWEDVPDTQIARGTAAFAFLPLESWSYYIPAYILYSLRQIHTFDTEAPQHLVRTLTCPDGPSAIFRVLATPAQRVAILAFLTCWHDVYPWDIDAQELLLWRN